MKKLVFSGCSFTAGHGWNEHDPTNSTVTTVSESPNLWVNLCYQNIKQFKNLKLINVGIGGASNTEIFQSTIKSISDHGDEIDTIFCQWTAMPRYNFKVGFELWNTDESLNTTNRIDNINLNNGSQWSRRDVNNLLNKFKVMHHLHWEILKVVEYSNIISKIAKQMQIKNVFFINGLCPWDDNYFTQLTNAKSNSYTPFTKKEILNIDSRSDQDIFILYSQAHQHYKEAGGIDESRWINLYNSFLKNRIDFNFDKIHPGIQSNQLYYQIIYLEMNYQRNVFDKIRLKWFN
jgi:hypothetical protein